MEALEHGVRLNMPPAAYISSLAQSPELCPNIWPGFDEHDIDGGLMRSDVESSLSDAFLPNAGIYDSSCTPSQKSLSAKIEAKACHLSCWVLPRKNATWWRTFASIVFWGWCVAFRSPGFTRVAYPGPLISG